MKKVSEGFNLLPEELKQKALNALRRAQKSARSKIGKKVFSNMTKAGLKSTGMAWTLFIVFAMKSANASDQEISIAVYDELTFGLGSAANEAYWGLANEIAQGAMDKTFGYVHGEESKQNTSSGPKRPLLELPSEKSKRTLRAGDLIGW